MLKNFLVIAILLFASSCSVPNWYKPRGYFLFRMMPKGGSPGYNLGWVHGCQSGAGTQFGGRIYTYFYTWSRDQDIASSKSNLEVIRKRYKKELKDVNWNDPADVKQNLSDYNLVFWDAHFFCRQVVLGTVQMADMDAPLPGEARFEPSKHNVGSVWRINGKGDPRWGSTGRGGGLW